MEKLSNFVENSSVDNEIEEYVRELYNEIVTDKEVSVPLFLSTLYHTFKI